MAALLLWWTAGNVVAQVDSIAGAVAYETLRDPKGPWVIHVIRVSRREPRLQIQSLHATGTALGLATVTAQTKLLESALPLAAINGDFYERSGSYAGDPRGLQIVDGEMISAPGGGASFWIDAVGQPHIGETKAELEVSWSGIHRPITLNSFRETNGLVLYTPAIGTSTHTRGGREWVLARRGNDEWLPLRPGRAYHAIVREIREGGDFAVAGGTMVLSIGPAVAAASEINLGQEVAISTGTQPALRGVRNAISGGPVLVRNGKRQRIKASGGDAYESSAMMERHPRSGIGWNEEYFILVAVDGRHPGVSVGMTLDEFGLRLAQLGCDEAFNLDGGGSSTLWYDGKARNFLCDGYEREVANSLVVVQKQNAPATGGHTRP